MGYYKKKLLAVLLLFLFIIFFVSSLSINSYALTDVLNAETVIIDDYEQNEVSFVAWAYDYLENYGGIDNDSDNNIVALKEFMQEIRAGRYVYYQRYGNTGRIICWCYNGISNSTWQSGTYVTWSGNTSLTTDGIYLTGMSWYDLTFTNGNPSFVHQYTNDPAAYFIPQSVFTKKDLVTVNFVAKYIPASYGEGDNISVNATVVGWGNLFTALNDINTTNKDTKNEVKKLNDFMKDTSYDNNDVQVVSPDIDVDDTSINDVFNAIRDAFTNENDYDSDIIIPIPYINQSVRIPGDMMYQIAENHPNLEPIIVIVNTYWYFVVSIYIVKDVYGYMKAAKEGELDEIKESDIKTEVL